MSKFKHHGHEELWRQLTRESLERSLLYEGLIYTHSLNMLLPELRSIGFNKKDFEFNPNKNIIIVRFTLNKDNQERYQELNRIMDNIGGWFHGASIANILLPNKLDFLEYTDGQVTLQYEPKYDIEVVMPDKLYHLTKQNKVNKIKKLGLTPRSAEQFFNFKDRVYFALNKNSLYDLAKQKKQIELNRINAKKYSDENIKNNKIEQSGKFAILTIAPKGSKVYTRFFKDPNFFDGYYTKENIHPFAIKNIEYFEF